MLEKCHLDNPGNLKTCQFVQDVAKLPILATKQGEVDLHVFQCQ